jgi:hypothetical protein
MFMTATKYDPYPRFVSEESSDIDEFEGGAHKRVAEALAQIIERDGEGKKIGVEGTWGSGKSTAIEIANGKLRKDPQKGRKLFVFTFDAWAHQNDPIRRVFLEELIAEVTRKWEQNDNWKELLKDLQSRKKIVQEDTGSDLSWVAKVSLALVPLIPLSLLILNGSDNSLLKGWLNQANPYVTYTSLALIFAPYCLVLFELGRLTTSGKHINESWKKISRVFTRETEQTTTFKTIEGQEATSIEFNRFFDDLLAEAYARNIRLVVIIENLDRLPNEDIKKLWATMRGFFAHTKNSHRSEALSNLTLVVPFDRDHIEEVFSDKQNREDVIGRQHNGFIEKTFDIVLRVPPPILTDWKGFLQTQLDEALGSKCSPNSKAVLFQLFEARFSSETIPITPRGIKSYINNLVLQLRIWNDSIPIEMHSAYILHRDKIGPDARSLRTGGIFDERTTNLLRNHHDWQRWFAAIHFNVDPEIALQVLLDEKVKEFLTKQEISSLEETSSSYGFLESLDRVIGREKNEWASREPEAFFNAILTFNGLKKINRHEAVAIWGAFIEASKFLPGSLDISQNMLAASSLLVTHCQPFEIEQTSLTLLNRIPKTGGREGGKDWLKTFLAIIGSVIDEDKRADIETEFSHSPWPKIDSEFLIGLLAEARNHPLETSPDFLNTGFAEVAASHLKNSIVPDYMDKTLSDAIIFASRTDWQIDWKQISDSLSGLLENLLPSAELSKIALLISSFSEVAQNKVAACKYDKTQLTNGTFAFAFRKLWDSEYFSEAMDLIFVTWCSNSVEIPKADNHQAFGPLQESHTLVDQVQQMSLEMPEGAIDGLVRRSVKGGIFSTLFGWTDKNNASRNLHAEVLKGMLQHPEVELSSLTIARDYDRLEGILSPEAQEKFLRRFEGWNSHLKKHLQKDENWKSISPRFLIRSGKLGLGSFGIASAIILQKAALLDTDRLFDELSNYTLAFQNLVIAIQLGQPDELPLSVQNLIALVFEKTLKNEPPIAPEQRKAIEVILTSMNPGERSRFAKNARDQLLAEPNSNNAPLLLQVFGKVLLTSGDMDHQPDETIRKLVGPTVESQDTDAIDFLTDHLATEAVSLIRQARDENRHYLMKSFKAIQPKLGWSEEELQERLAKLELSIEEKDGESGSGDDGDD